MAKFKCPVCGRIHYVPDEYGHKDYICQNSSNAPNQKIFKQVEPIDQLTRGGYNWNRLSTKVNEAREVTIHNVVGTYRNDGAKQGTLPGKNY